MGTDTAPERSTAAPTDPVHVDGEGALEEVVGVQSEAELRSLVGTYAD